MALGPDGTVSALAILSLTAAIRARVRAFLMLLVAIGFGVAAVIFLIVALWFRLSYLLGPIVASLACAGVSILLALAAFGIAAAIRARRNDEEQVAKILGMIEAQGRELGQQAEEAVAAAPLASLGGAFSAGLILAALLR